MAGRTKYRKYIRPAMATEFSLLLRGDDAEHLTAVAGAVFAEIERIEKLLSRHDPTAEVARVNRAAAGESLRIPWELAEILTACDRWHRLTDGYFDIGYSDSGSGERLELLPHPVPMSRHSPQVAVGRKPSGVSNFGDKPDGSRRAAKTPISNSGKTLPPYSNVLTKQSDAAALDLGGFGKGYALDCGLTILREYGIEHALLCGGGSSWLALGTQAEQTPWKVQLPATASEGVADRLALRNEALSVSATRHGQEVSDIRDPQSGRPIEHDARCAVVAATAAAAEVWSTALLAMGPERAGQWIARGGDDQPRAVYWSVP